MSAMGYTLATYFVPRIMLGIGIALFLAKDGYSQQRITYFTDRTLSETTKERKAYYRLEETYPEPGLRKMELYQMQGDRLLLDQYYRGDKPAGTWTTYRSDGTIERTWNMDAISYRKDIPDGMVDNAMGYGDNDTYVAASFPGGEMEMIHFIGQNISSPPESMAIRSGGRALIRFVIEADGTAVPYGILQGVDPYIDFRVWQLIQAMPKWQPAQYKGEPIATCMILPVRLSVR